MSEHPFLRFIDLVNFDKTIHSIETEQETIAEDIAVTEKQQQELDLLVNQAESKVTQLKKRVDDQEL
jgi:F0F1-type ATP synthase membrane subunit b/b'